MVAKKDGNGYDPTERMVRILESIEREIHAFREETKERLGRLETQTKQTNEHLGRLETQVRGTNRRLRALEKRVTS